jgi:hypothetical protein
MHCGHVALAAPGRRKAAGAADVERFDRDIFGVQAVDQ